MLPGVRGAADERLHRDAEAFSVVGRVVNSLGWEIFRGQFAGLLAGATSGAVLAVLLSGVDPMWHESAVLISLSGMLMGGFLGGVSGSVAGLTLRFMRRVPVGLAATTTGLVVALTVAVTLFLIGWTSPSPNPWRFPGVIGGFAGVSAACATPWIRRSPTNASH
ncbi:MULTISPECIES: hypothetical protein [Nocardioides]|uniref:Major facilitator superfamily (MFS) profile domain-containing protein n=1 Tax=Nocardioides vastitatis TaxID=2568655 RepID=A0ABW0ZCC3_9ACTN|nr:hypothetical protein [Nocardioides sp.]THI90833.1 hypothetical protein E7Z54_22585 [Nocardioides sp.]